MPRGNSLEAKAAFEKHPGGWRLSATANAPPRSAVSFMPAPRVTASAYMSGFLRARLSFFQSIRSRILATAACVTIVVYLAIAVVFIIHARSATRIEIAHALDTTEQLVTDASEQAAGGESSFIKALATGFVAPRHVAISVLDQDNAPVPFDDKAPAVGESGDWDAAPRWFYALIAPMPEVRSILLRQNGDFVGTVILTSRPDDEINEAWANFRAFTDTGAVGVAAILLILGAVLGRLLAPLVTVSKGLERLEEAQYAVRLPPSPVKELDVISARFNALASALAAAREDNVRLSRDLVSLQDEERRHLAMELHDEFGPSLFGVKVYADSLAFLVMTNAPELASRVEVRTREIMAVVDKLNAITRSIMKRLRPMALGKVPLAELLSDLVADFQSKAPDVSIVLSVADLRPTFGEQIDLTIYRCLQEGVANALKHAHPHVVQASASEQPAGFLAIEIRDDGAGLTPGAQLGYGLTGMRDRVRAIGGTMAIDRPPGGGAVVSISLPLHATDDRVPQPAESRSRG